MPIVVKTALISGLLVGLGWFALNVRVEGRTPYGHFRAAGGETAVLEGWDWLRSGVSAGADSAWAGTKATASSGLAVLSGWWDSAAHAAAAGWDAFQADEAPKGSSQAASETDRSGGATSESSGRAAVPPEPPMPRAAARAGVERLEQAAERGAPAPAEKARTRIERRIAPAEKAALDAKIATRR